MNKSESIKELATALSKAQAEFKDVSPNVKGARGDYADLGAMIKMSRPILSKHGLSVCQLTGNDGVMISVETVLMHSSGEHISSTFCVPADNVSKNAVQAMGSSITYARRYSLAAILNITKDDDDDDANSAQNEIKNTITPDQVKDLKQLITSTKVDIDALTRSYGVSTLVELTFSQYSNAVSRLRKRLSEQQYVNVD